MESNIKGIQCTYNNMNTKIRFDYDHFKISTEIYEYDRLVNIQTKNKEVFLLKIILMKLNYEIDIKDKAKQQSLIISFENVDGRDLCKNILFSFLTTDLISNTFDYQIFIKIPVLQDIFDKCNMMLTKYIEVLRDSKILSGKLETVIDSLIKKETEKDLGCLINRINYISVNLIESLPKAKDAKEIIRKDLEIPESEILKELEKTQTKIFTTNFEPKNFDYVFKTTTIETSNEFPKVKDEIQSYRGNTDMEQLFEYSKNCFNKKMKGNDIIEVINFVKGFPDQNLIKRINPLTFLKNKRSVNYNEDTLSLLKEQHI